MSTSLVIIPVYKRSIRNLLRKYGYKFVNITKNATFECAGARHIHVLCLGSSYWFVCGSLTLTARLGRSSARLLPNNSDPPTRMLLDGVPFDPVLKLARSFVIVVELVCGGSHPLETRLLLCPPIAHLENVLWVSLLLINIYIEYSNGLQNNNILPYIYHPVK